MRARPRRRRARPRGRAGRARRSPTPTACTRRRCSSCPSGGALCIWEFFYLARPDSRLEGIEVHNARVRMGERLAQEAPVEADLVLPIPDSGTPAAIGFARALGLPVQRGADQEPLRPAHVHPARPGAAPAGDQAQVPPRRRGRRASASSRSTTRSSAATRPREIVRMLFDAGATEVHLRISSPPVIGQCFYGIDLADPSEMIASTRTVEEVREHVGATSLAYLSHDGLVEATRRPASAPLPRLPHRRLPDRGARRGARSSGSSRREPRRPASAARARSGCLRGSVAPRRSGRSRSSCGPSTATSAARSWASIASRSPTR